MTAPEVCQYVNQALANEYVYQPPLRYELRYTALSARHVREDMWEVSVKVIAEPQRLSEGRWAATPLFETKTYVEQYYFCETTGALTKR